jgi:hypothetical protein
MKEAHKAGPVKKLYMLSWFSPSIQGVGDFVFFRILNPREEIFLPYNVYNFFEFFSLGDIK